jgi:hypothetical protein
MSANDKLPEWPKECPLPMDDPAWERLYLRQLAFWESRARLAVEALEDYALWSGVGANCAENSAARALDAIGFLPPKDVQP